MKVKNLFENREGKKLGELWVFGELLAPDGVRRENWYGNLKCENSTSNAFITSLEGAPISVAGNFICNDLPYLTSLEGRPEHIGGHFFCNGNSSITSLEGGPTTIFGDFSCNSNPRITSLENIHKHILAIHNGAASFMATPIKSHVLGLLKIKNLHRVTFGHEKRNLAAIINKYLPEGDLLDCQEELIDAGFEEYAKL